MAYTFRRSKPKAKSSTIQTKVEYEPQTVENDDEQLKYAKYTFWMSASIVLLLIGTLGYIMVKGLPVKVR